MSDYQSWRYGKQVYISSLKDILCEIRDLQMHIERISKAKRGHAVKFDDYVVGLRLLEMQVAQDIADRKKSILDAENIHKARQIKRQMSVNADK